MTYSWTDRNGDRRYQAGEESANPTAATLAGTIQLDPNITQPYSHDATVYLERQVSSSIGARIGFVYKTEDDLIAQYNPGRPISAYTVPVNLGLRWDRYRGWMPENRQMAFAIGPVSVPEQMFPEPDFYTWSNLGPCIGVTYDIAGDGKTVGEGELRPSARPARTASTAWRRTRWIRRTSRWSSRKSSTTGRSARRSSGSRGSHEDASCRSHACRDRGRRRGRNPRLQRRPAGAGLRETLRRRRDHYPAGHEIQEAERYPNHLLEDLLKKLGAVCLYNVSKNEATSRKYITEGQLARTWNYRPDLITLTIGEENDTIVKLVTECFDNVKDHDFAGATTCASTILANATLYTQLTKI